MARRGKWSRLLVSALLVYGSGCADGSTEHQGDGSQGGGTTSASQGGSAAAGAPGGNGAPGGSGSAGGGECGDGYQDPGEACDDGPDNSNVAPDACRLDCELPSCGDGVTDPSNDEVCDGSNGPDHLCSDDCYESGTIHHLGIQGDAYDIGRDNQDRVHFIWKTGQDLSYARLETGAIESQESMPSATSIFTRWARPRLAVRPDGQALHTSWTYSGGTGLWHVWRDGNGDWHEQAAWTAGGSGLHIGFPAAAIDATNTVHLIAQRWYDTGTGNADGIAYGRKPPGQSWTWTIIDQNPPEFRHCSMFTDRDGGVHGTWKVMGQPGQYRYAPSGGSLVDDTHHYEIPKAPGTNINCSGDSFVTDDGTVHHGFTSWNENGMDHSVKLPGGEFSVPTRASDGPFLDCDFDYDPWPSIAVTPTEQPWVAWADNPCDTDRLSRVVLARLQGSSWKRTVLDDEADVDHFGRPVMTATQSSAYVVWRHDGGELYLAKVDFSPAVVP